MYRNQSQNFSSAENCVFQLLSTNNSWPSRPVLLRASKLNSLDRKGAVFTKSTFIRFVIYHRGLYGVGRLAGRPVCWNCFQYSVVFVSWWVGRLGCWPQSDCVSSRYQMDSSFFYIGRIGTMHTCAVLRRIAIRLAPQNKRLHVK